MGSSEVSIISCLSLHSKITRVPPLGSQIQKSPDNPTLAVSVPRICHCLRSSSQNTACPMTLPGGHSVPMWELLLTGPASPQPQLCPVVSRGERPPLSPVVFFSHQPEPCQPPDSGRWPLGPSQSTFDLWALGRDAGVWSMSQPGPRQSWLTLLMEH